jgi:hypothetical protein
MRTTTVDEHGALVAHSERCAGIAADCPKTEQPAALPKRTAPTAPFLCIRRRCPRIDPSMVGTAILRRIE